jgi:hypothetical protein
MVVSEGHELMHWLLYSNRGSSQERQVVAVPEHVLHSESHETHIMPSW